MNQPHVVVVGGGIAGLAAAWTFANPKQARNRSARSLRPRITVLESSPQLGGKIRTSEFAGVMVEEGPDAFLGKSPWAMHLCDQLGLEKELTSPLSQQAWLWNGGSLQRFPRQTMLGVPSSLWSLRNSRALTARGVVRAGADYVLPSSFGQDHGDATIADTLGKRLGPEVLYNLIDPLLGGINAGSVDTLSLSAASPALADLVSSNRSLLRAVRSRVRKRNETEDPIFFSTRGGLSVMVETLGKRLLDLGASIELNAAVERVAQQPDGKWVLQLQLQDQIIEADAVVVATPAPQAAALLRSTDMHISALLDQIRYASVGIVRLAYDRSAITHGLDGTGFVVPAKTGRLLTACSWASSKWEDIGKSDHAVFRASVGRVDDDRFTYFSDEELIDALHLELSEALGIDRRPSDADVTRWTASFPQYEVGHIARVQEIERLLHRHLGMTLAGAAYHGLGIPACIHSGFQAGERILDRLASAK